MNLLTDLWTEARAAHTPLLLLGYLVLLVVGRGLGPDERRRIRVTGLLVGLHLVLLPVASGLRAAGVDAHGSVTLLRQVLAVLAGVGVFSSVVFAFLLRRIGLRAPLILRDLFGAAAGIAGLLLLARGAGVDLSGVLATSAVLTAVVGFSMQDTLGNVMAGLAVQVDQSLVVGDWVKVGDVVGRVAEIRWRYTAIETRNWETVIVPNSALMRGQFTVLGRRHGQPMQWRRWVWFNVDFRFAPTQVICAVEEAVRVGNLPNVSSTPAPNCVLMDVHDSYCRYAVRYWLTDLAVDDPTDSAVRTRLYFALQRAKIPLSIPAFALFTTDDSEDRRAHKERDRHDHRIVVLRQLTLFDGLGDADLEHLAERMREAPFGPGETLTRQGALAHWLYILAEGEVSVWVRNEHGDEQEVNRIQGPGFFGETAVLTGLTRAATVIAVGDVECYRLDAEALRAILGERPQIAEHFARVMAERSAELHAVREGLDAEGKQRRAQTDATDLLGRIRSFFSLS